MTRDDEQVWRQYTSGVTRLGEVEIRPVVRPIRVERVAPQSPTLDLHGLTIQNAYEVVKTHIRDARLDGLKYVMIITGISGTIRKEFTFWLEEHPAISRIEPLNGGGAFRVYLKRQR